MFNVSEEWHPKEEELKVIESSRMQIKSDCENIKEKNSATEKKLKKWINQISDHYQRN